MVRVTDLHAASRYTERRARTELLGSIGAGVLGAGVAPLLRDFLGALALPFLAVGVTVHGLAMYERHRLDASAGTSVPPWSKWAYRACWMLLLSLVAYVWLVQD